MLDIFSDGDLEAFVRSVYQGAYLDGSFDKKRVAAYAKVFTDAVTEGFGKSIGTGIDFDSPDDAMLAALRDNVFHFSAAKNRAEIIELSAALRDERGMLRSFRDWAQEAYKVTDEFQERYMRVEYDCAVNAATIAARWSEFQDDDIIVFRTAGDSRVRPEHRRFDGIALPKGHPFWRTFLPPLAWNCRCTVEVSHSGRITPEKDLPWDEVDNVPPIFRSNFAADGMAFPPNHPYYNYMTNKAESEVKSMLPKQ